MQGLVNHRNSEFVAALLDFSTSEVYTGDQHLLHSSSRSKHGLLYFYTYCNLFRKVISQFPQTKLQYLVKEWLKVSWRIRLFIIWRAPRAGKMNQIARCDWLPERARWSHLARRVLPAVSCKQYFTKSHIINPLLTKFVRSRWLDIGLVLFFASL